jgi:Flp pilus assembly protein TadD
LQKRAGRYNVNVLDENRFRSLYFSNRAVEALTGGQIEDAKALTRQALDCDPKCCVVLNLQGVVEENTGESGLAEQTFRQAVALDPKDPAPMANLERLLRRDGRIQEADAFQQMSEKVQKRDPFFHADLAEEAIDSGDFKEAQRRIKLAQALEPLEPDFFMLESRLRVALGQWDEAIKAIQAAERNSDPGQRAALEAQVTLVEQLKARGHSNI